MSSIETRFTVISQVPLTHSEINGEAEEHLVASSLWLSTFHWAARAPETSRDKGLAWINHVWAAPSLQSGPGSSLRGDVLRGVNDITSQGRVCVKHRGEGMWRANEAAEEGPKWGCARGVPQEAVLNRPPSRGAD